MALGLRPDAESPSLQPVLTYTVLPADAGSGDAETGHEQWIDTSSRALRRAHNDWWIQRQGVLNETFTKSNVDSVSIRTDQDYVKSLLNLFAKRN